MAAAKLLLTGASGYLGQRLKAQLRRKWQLVVGGRRAEGEAAVLLDLANPQSLRHAFDAVRPAAVVHAGGIADVDECERRPDLAEQVNVRAVEVLAALCAGARARFVHFSTDYVFDGEKGRYAEDDEARPMSVYGRGKLQSERLALAACPGCAILRVSNCYGRPLIGRTAYIDHLRARLAAGQPVASFIDQWRSPTAADQLPEVVDRVLSDPALSGVFHWGGADRVSRYEMNLIFCRATGFDERLIVRATAAQHGFLAPRPSDTSLDSSRLAEALRIRPWTIEQGFSAMQGLRGDGDAARI